jgi:hypothetical protein
MLAGALIVQSSSSLIHGGGALATQAYISLERGLSLMGVDKNDEVYKLLEGCVHHSFIISRTAALISEYLYEEFATVEIVMES